MLLQNLPANTGAKYMGMINRWLIVNFSIICVVEVWIEKLIRLGLLPPRAPADMKA